MRLKRFAATIFVAVLGASALVGSASVATADPSHVCDVRMIEWGVNAPGPDKPSNANAEFKRLFNPGSASVDVEGWYVSDAFPHVYKLKGVNLPAGSPFRSDHDSDASTPDHFVMPAQSNVYVYNGTGSDGNPTNLTAALYSNLGHHHNNAGDTLSFRDLDGTAVDWVTYTPYRTRHAC
jgi:hypothetical protein